MDCLFLAGKEVRTRQRIVVLGTGWGAHSFLQSIDAVKYEVVVVSPRKCYMCHEKGRVHPSLLPISRPTTPPFPFSTGNFMLFTPMLAASAVGTVEYRSITEVRFPPFYHTFAPGWHSYNFPPINLIYLYHSPFEESIPMRTIWSQLVPTLTLGRRSLPASPSFVKAMSVTLRNLTYVMICCWSQ